MKSKMKKKIILSLFTFGYVLTFLFPKVSVADCGCQLGSNQIYVVGYEYIAQSCPPNEPSDSTYYIYIVNAINCKGSKITYFASYGDLSGTPASIISYYTSQGLRVIRNPSGTHLIVVQNGQYPFTGEIAGISMAEKPAGVYSSSPAENVNELCTTVTLPDQDGDSYPDCLDCDVADADQNAICPSGQENEKNFGPPHICQ